MPRGGYNRPTKKAELLEYYIQGLSILAEWCEDMEKASPDWTLRYLDQRAQAVDRVIDQLGLTE